jgi:heme exporter protein A
MTRERPALEGRGLACRRGRRWLFRDLDIRVEPGSLTWLRGANGSGKTSLLRMLCGLSAPTAGQVLWGGQPLPAAGQAARHGLLYIGHMHALKDDLSLHEALAFLAQLAGLEGAGDKAAAALAAAGLAAQATLPVRNLSQGQRRRGALARLALDDAPRIWILDEPFDALDQASTQALAARIAGHAARGGAVLLTSHQPVALPGLVDFEMPSTAAG